ncbi:MAG TPA: hypothetical protein VKR06_44375 [Ktedonosporobacter sp.]|nr:hypothetical protein [Ktedonosporobacter sp.]
MKHPQALPDPLITIEVTHNELIALNLAAMYYLRYGEAISPVYPAARDLLRQFQQRMFEKTHPREVML